MTQNWLLLDFDNCQMATEHLAVPSLIKRFNELYADKIGRDLTYEEFKQHFHGQARETLCANLSEYFGILIEYPILYKNREWHVLQMLKETKVEMAPHLLESLEILQREGYKFAFVSNNPIQRGLTAMRNATNGKGEHLARFFGTGFFEAGDVQKPKPDVYNRTMEQLDTTSDYCYAVEDSISGVCSAVGAGITTFGYLGFADNREEMAKKLKEKGAIACFEDWQDFPQLLKQYSSYQKAG
ncbi:MAG: HAD family hydrolase [Alphaproteobacteria bacterium]|nr:HAD family hydrolase [Alphaproteobacteria bacterium]